MTQLLSTKCYIYASKLSLLFASNIVFCHSQVTDMETHIKKCKTNEQWSLPAKTAHINVKANDQ